MESPNKYIFVGQILTCCKKQNNNKTNQIVYHAKFLEIYSSLAIFDFKTQNFSNGAYNKIKCYRQFILYK